VKGNIIAIELYDQVLGQDENHVYALVGKSGALQQQGLANEALSLAERALKVDPHNANVLLLIAASLSNLGRHDEALVFIDKAVQSNPDPYFTTMKALVLRNLRRFEEAKLIIDGVLERYPNEVNALYVKADILYQLGYTNDALPYYRKTLELDPDPKTAAVLEYRANALAKIGEYSKALSYMKKVLEIAPNEPYAFYTIASIHALQENVDLTLSFLQKAVEKEPSLKSDAMNDREFEKLRMNPRFIRITATVTNRPID
jgi:tetratricopeptide (TPR) repeat protein